MQKQAIRNLNKAAKETGLDTKTKYMEVTKS
jgi:hypothetical protein